MNIDKALNITDLDAALKGDLSGAVNSLKEFTKGAESLRDPIGDAEKLRKTLSLFSRMTSEKAELQEVFKLARLLRFETLDREEQ